MKRLKKRIATGLIALSVFLAACQQTPETPPVIYRGEGLPADSIIDPIPEGQSKEIDAPAHWTEEAYRTKNEIKINADADILVPDISNTPVVEMVQKPLTVDELKRLIAYFAGDEKLLKKPELTKADLEFQLEQLQARKGEYGNFYKNSLVPEAEKRLEALIESAPETVETVYMDIAFTYPQKDLSKSIWAEYNQEEEIQEVQTDFEAIVETGEALKPEVSAVTYNEEAGTNSSFSYSKGSYITAAQLRRYTSSTDFARGVEETKWSQDPEVTDAFELYCDRLDEIASGDAGIESQAKATAEKALAGLGITQMALANIEKGIALNLSSSRWDREAETGAAETAYILTYYRNVGGLLGFYPSFSAGYDSLPEQVYKPPFFSERITFVVTKEGLYAFSWENMAEEVRTVAANTKLLPFDAVKERFLEHMGYTAAWHNLEPGDDYYWRYDIYRVELRSFPTAAFDRPDHVWMIPVWVFFASNYSKYGDQDVHLVDEEVMISALDGGFVSLD
jgi:hypothetical protein